MQLATQPALPLCVEVASQNVSPSGPSDGGHCARKEPEVPVAAAEVARPEREGAPGAAGNGEAGGSGNMP